MSNMKNNTGTPLIGEIYQGVVVGIQKYGAFVNFGFEQDGLVPLKEISHDHIENVEAALSLKQPVSVKVIGFDQRGFPKLSIKEVSGGSDEGGYSGGGAARSGGGSSFRKPARSGGMTGQKPVEGTVYNGIVVKIVDFGAFVDFGFGQDGMVHISQVAPHRIPDVHSVLAVREQVRVKFIGLDDRGRIKLSIKEAIGHTAIDGPLAPGARHVESDGPKPVKGETYEGTVVTIISSGAFVKFGFEKDGMVHVREISDEHIGNIEDVLSVGDTVRVKVIDFDDHGRTKLSIKQAE
jgi:predicted RNA-binding protein with RPS1 domain